MIDTLAKKTWTQNNMFIARVGGVLSGYDYNIKSISMPDFTRSAVEEYNNATWQFTYGRQEIYMISITYVDNEEDQIYEKALQTWNSQHQQYPWDNAFDITVAKTTRRDRNKALSGVLFKKAIIDSISGLQWDNSSQNQLLEFTITFKCSEHELVEA